MKILVRNEGGALRFLGRQYGASGKLEHFRAYQEDLQPHIDRVKELSALTPRKGYSYLGSVPRIVVDDWLRKQGKTWRDYAIDKELKAKFLVYFRTEYSKMTANTYRERPLTINRAKHRHNSILNMWRKENAR